MANTWNTIEKHVNKNIPQYDKTAKKWSKAIAKGYLTEDEIIYLRKYLGSSSKANPYVKIAISAELDAKLDATPNGFPITPEQTNKGITWLREFLWKKNGSARNTKENRVFGDRERRIIQDFKEFRLKGLTNASQNAYVFYLPIYEVIAEDGSSFEYTTNMGRIEVVG